VGGGWWVVGGGWWVVGGGWWVVGGGWWVVGGGWWVVGGCLFVLTPTRYNPLYFQNHIYLNEYLLSGTYNLSFHDPLGKNPPSQQYNCAPYSLTYSLVAADIPAGACDADVLPSDLNTTAGRLE
jgi:hypothetical protein